MGRRCPGTNSKNLRDLSKQIVLQALDNNRTYSSGKCSLTGYFGIAGLTGENTTYLYLGKVSFVSCNEYSLRAKNSDGSANLQISGGKYIISCNQETEIELPLSNVQSLTLLEGTRKTDLRMTMKENKISFIVPAVKNGEIRILKK